MRPIWLLALSLIGAAAQDTPTTEGDYIDPPPATWVTGEPYTTIGRATPTGSLATITTTIQKFPTDVVFVATGVRATPRAPDHTAILREPAIRNGVPGYMYMPLVESAVKQSTAFTIDVAKTNALTVCWYPISGNYGRLPRILFYVTIAAAVLLRTHLPWLYLGALAASLTYSGSAAIHACLLIWRGPGWGELDLYPLLGILSASCIIMVPLINWSTTIRTAGRPDLQRQQGDERAKELKEFDAASRIILIFWSFLVTVGFLSVFIALQEGYGTTSNGNWLPISNISSGTFSCAPESGELNVTVGQVRVIGLGEINAFNYLSITKEFLEANNCGSPCSVPAGGPAIFRSVDELEPLTVVEFGQVIGGDSATKTQAWLAEVTNKFAFGWSYLIVYVLLQGAWTICFGRNKPSESRAVLYHYFSRFSISGRPNRDKVGNFQRRGAQAIALSAYLWSVFIVVVAVPLLIIDVVLIELFVRRLPQGESANHIGAWAPYASTGLVLFAAALAKSYETIKALLLQSGGNVRKIWRKIFPSKTKSSKLKHDKYVDALHKAKNVFKNIGSFVFGHDVRGGMSREWTSFIKFCKDPELSYDDYLDTTKPQILCTCPRDYECKKHKECVHRLVCTDRTKCGDCKACSGPGTDDDAWTDHECTCKGHKDHITEVSVAVSEGLVPAVDMTQTYSRSSHSSGYSAVSQVSRLSPDSIPQQALVPQKDPVPPQSPVSQQSPVLQKIPVAQAPAPQQASVPRRDSLPNPVSVPKRVPVPQRASMASIPQKAYAAPAATTPSPQQALTSKPPSAAAPTGK